jgi:DNA-binding transcriptional MerR regulator
MARINMEGMENIQGNGYPESAVADKSLFRIGEVSRVTATKPFVLRYWETEFPMLQPVKSPKGHRLYRREDIDTVFTIKRLLYNEGFTIAGDQALSGGNGTNGGEALADAPLHNEQIAAPQAMPPDMAMLNRKTLLDLRDSLRSLLTVLEAE